MGSNTQAALEFANQVVNPPDGWERNLSKEQLDTIDSGIKGKLGWGDSDTYVNAYAGSIRSLAKKFVVTGMDPAKAVTAATDAVFANSVSYETACRDGTVRGRLAKIHSYPLGPLPLP
ncbi:hypothetical protein [Aureimonas leprariae]|uniref:Uncharacterized protein n=1 Tax=Plantimonas leprariae TaxID=2615207 RepID=A0A7V7PQ18_9HYPH|nr:hypothetical protein [Aureimonas leprariae]KAB0680150.1 hypothetical protein F6X38_08130 [Aureimonas leprariae]